jgi:hypothetical protein
MKLALAIALACTGCPSKKTDDVPAAPPPSPSPSPAPRVAPPVAQPQAAPPAPVLPPPEATPNALTCALIFPQPLRDKYFPGIEVRDHVRPGPAAAECDLGTDASPARVSATCGEETSPEAIAAVIKLRVERMHGKPLAVGKGGVIMANAKGSHALVWDDDSPCQVQFEVPHAVDAAAFAKDLLAVLPVR